jgi:hypothetical protein
VRNCGSLCRVSLHDHSMNTGHKTFLPWLKHDVKHHSTFTFFIGTQSFPFIPDILQSGRVCGLAESVVTISHSVALSCPRLPAPARSCPLLPAPARSRRGPRQCTPPPPFLPTSTKQYLKSKKKRQATRWQNKKLYSTETKPFAPSCAGSGATRNPTGLGPGAHQLQGRVYRALTSGL